MNIKVLVLSVATLMVSAPVAVSARGAGDDLPFRLMQEVFKGTPVGDVMEHVPRGDRDGRDDRERSGRRNRSDAGNDGQSRQGHRNSGSGDDWQSRTGGRKQSGGFDSGSSGGDGDDWQLSLIHI